MDKVIIEADGGSRGNPGPAGYGAVVWDADRQRVLAERKEFLGVATNNVAEYRGLIAGLEAAAELGAREVSVRMDSKLVVEQLSGRWKVKHPAMIPLADRARRLVAGFDRVSFAWIPRAENSHADRLANEAMDDAPTVDEVRTALLSPADLAVESARAEAFSSAADTAASPARADAGSSAAASAAGGSSAVTSADAGSSAVTSADAGSSAVTSADAGSSAVASADAGSSAVTSADAGSSAVASADAGSSAVTSADAGSSAVASADAGSSAVTSADAGSSAVASADAGSSAVTSADGGSSAATSADAGSSAVTSADGGSSAATSADAGSPSAASSDAGSSVGAGSASGAKDSAPGWTGAMGKPTRLLLLRHGQTELSVERRYSGRGNPPLTELGREQVAAAAKMLATKGNIAAIVSSPLGRARETAEAAGRALGLPVRVLDGLIETDFGAWEGLTFPEAARQDPELHARWLGDPSVPPPGGGESFDQVRERIEGVRRDLVALYPGANVLVVSHVTPIKTLLQLALGVGPSLLYRLHLDLASLSIAEFYPDGGSSVRLANDTSYL
ncbi:bifunctional RNase H/acid phosphatase [Nocardia sp. NBC_01388]|uniref:bifunctional RNase H/acid phosphatase n=1 Tax=Nocardia sp. NBC_01388 TaxID=2903596 RepID=UPI003866EBCE